MRHIQLEAVNNKDIFFCLFSSGTTHLRYSCTCSIVRPFDAAEEAIFHEGRDEQRRGGRGDW